MATKMQPTQNFCYDYIVYGNKNLISKTNQTKTKLILSV